MDYNYIEIKRIGYGSNFNNIFVDLSNNIIKKQCFNSYGLNKIQKEIKFYKFLINNKIDFPFPTMFNFSSNSYEMEYLKNYEPLYKIIQNIEINEKNKIMVYIYDNLSKLHEFVNIKVTKDEYLKHLNIEIEDKLLERYKTIDFIIQEYSYIKYVNNIKIIPFYELVKLIKSEIYKIVNLKSEYCFVPIHGDCQFNNVLYDIVNQSVKFIDPRGYYGDSELYGIPEYDYAKVLFAITGYDEFDNRVIDKLDIINDNIVISINILDLHTNTTQENMSDCDNLSYTLENNIFQKENKMHILLMLSIWLGNSHCFIKNKNKLLYSYFIGMYLSSLYFQQKF